MVYPRGVPFSRAHGGASVARKGPPVRHTVSPILLACVALAVAPFSQAQAAPASPSASTGTQAFGIPKDCYAGSVSVSTSRYRYYIGAGGGKKENSARLKQKPLPFQPRHIALVHGRWAGDAGSERHLVVDSKGRLHVWNQSINGYTGTGTFTMKRISGNWAGTKALTSSNKYIYRSTGREIIRYEIGTGGVPTKRRVISGSGVGDVKTLTVDYSTPQADTLIATTTKGALLQLKARRGTTAAVMHRTLRGTGYQNFVTFQSGECWNRPRGGAYFGVTRSKAVFAYYDSNRTDTTPQLKGGRVGSWTHRTY